MLLAVIGFQLFGYRWFLNSREREAGLRMEQRIAEGHYSDDELMVVQLPLSMPYPRSMPAFEKADGEIEVQGKYYRYVKLRWYNDTLTLHVLRDVHKEEINRQKNDHLASQHESPAQGKHSTNVKFSPVDEFVAGVYKELFAPDFHTLIRVPVTVSMPHQWQSGPDCPPPDVYGA